MHAKVKLQVVVEEEEEEEEEGGRSGRPATGEVMRSRRFKGDTRGCASRRWMHRCRTPPLLSTANSCLGFFSPLRIHWEETDTTQSLRQLAAHRFKDKGVFTIYIYIYIPESLLAQSRCVMTAQVVTSACEAAHNSPNFVRE